MIFILLKFFFTNLILVILIAIFFLEIFLKLIFFFRCHASTFNLLKIKLRSKISRVVSLED